MGGGGSRARQQVGAAKISVPAVGDVPQDAGWSQPLQISTTPRRESIEEREGMRECVAETPKTSEGRRDFPCFCPLCMCWYKAALITRCCAHSFCLLRSAVLSGFGIGGEGGNLSPMGTLLRVGKLSKLRLLKLLSKSLVFDERVEESETVWEHEKLGVFGLLPVAKVFEKGQEAIIAQKSILGEVS